MSPHFRKIFQQFVLVILAVPSAGAKDIPRVIDLGPYRLTVAKRDIFRDHRILGRLGNASDATLESCLVKFAIKYRESITAAAIAIAPAPIPPGGRWDYVAPVFSPTNTYTDSVSIQCVVTKASGERVVGEETRTFDRRWSPFARWEQRRYEKAKIPKFKLEKQPKHGHLPPTEDEIKRMTTP